MKKKMLVIIASLVLMLYIGYSLAYLRTNTEGSNNNLTIADFHVDLITDITNITMNNTYPMSDAEGLDKTENKVTFAIKNNGDIVANYKVSLVDDTNVSTLKNSDVRYQLTRTIGSNQSETFEITNLESTGLIDSGSIDKDTTITYELICWVDYNSTANGATFKKAILVEGMQSSNLDKSGANFPELTDNMIPVYYDKTSDTTGVWRKADSKNLNSTYKWFDYDEQMWANAVTVKETGTNTRDYYLNASSGTEINMADITTMWVWIPRYKYVIFNGNNETAEEQEIKVMFEHGIDTTGTVKCHDDILLLGTHSEICTDTTNSTIVNHKSTYTHPAFCFGTKNLDGSCDGEELTGFWMAKFEMSTDDQTCNETPNATNCNKTGLNILVKPDQSSLNNISVSNMFANIRRMESNDNIHGFNQSTSAVTYLDANSNLTGEIAFDSNNFDTHMIKNMEWGAVAYLSQSKYGKLGNTLYTGEYKEVYINNNSDYKTGYSGGSYDSNSSTTTTYLYNNLTDQGNGQGYLGAGASTTGNIYGIYDMSGGSFEYVMANVAGRTNLLEFSVSSAETWTTSVFPLSKYYDRYSFQNSSVISIGKLGDATREIVKNLSSVVGGWYNDTSSMFLSNTEWMIRGGYASNKTMAGTVNFSNRNGASRDLDTTRPVLTINREMPWLNE